MPSHLFSASPSVSHLLPFILSIHHVCVHLFFHHTPAKLPLLAASSSNSCFYVASLQLSPLAGLLYRDQQQPASCSYIAMHSAHNDTASKKRRRLSTDSDLIFVPITSRRWRGIFIHKLWDLRFSTAVKTHTCIFVL